MKKHAIIVAGGSGLRMGTSVPKQFLVVGKRPILMQTISCFWEFDQQIELLVVLPQAHISLWNKLCTDFEFIVPHRTIVGGEQRFYSVKNALNAILTNEGVVAVHDAVRPFVSKTTIAVTFNSAVENGSGIPVIPVVDSVRHISGAEYGPVNRTTLRIVQTPQCFNLRLLKEAYQTDYKPAFTDDASVFEKAGHSLHYVEGNAENIKITTMADMVYADFLSRKTSTRKI